MDCHGLSLTVLDCAGLFWTIMGCSGLSWTVWDCSGLNSAGLNSTELHDLNLSCLVRTAWSIFDNIIFLETIVGSSTESTIQDSCSLGSV